MSKAKVALPAVRFEGFSGEWNYKKLATEVDFFSGLTYSPQNTVKTNGTLVLRSSNVKGGQIDFKDCVYVKNSVVNSDNLQKGDIAVVVRNGSRALIGKHAMVTKSMPSTVIGAFMTGIRAKQPNFINALLDTALFKKAVEKNLGATINQITNGAFKEMDFNFPISTNEQTKIGSFFQDVDKQLKLHQDKLAKLQQLKKAMLGKMFPKAGQTVPELRFAGFSEKWEVEPLGTNASFNKGKGFTKGDLNTFGVPIVLYGRLYTNYQTIITEVDTFVSSESKGIMSKGREVIVPASGESAEDIARASAVLQPNVILGGDLNIIYPNNKILPSFLALIITYSCCQAELAKKAQGKSVVQDRKSVV